MDSLEELKQKIDQFNKERDWDKFHSPSNLAKSIVIEAGELMECFQWSDDDYNIEDVKEELADVMNYCIQLASKLNLDIKEIVYLTVIFASFLMFIELYVSMLFIFVFN